MTETKFLYYKKIRTVWDSEKQVRFYCLKDVIKTLTNVKDTKNFLKKLRKRNKSLASNWSKLVLPIEMDTKSGRQKLNSTDAKSLLIIIQFMRYNKKAKLFMRWIKRLEDQHNG